MVVSEPEPIIVQANEEEILRLDARDGFHGVRARTEQGTQFGGEGLGRRTLEEEVYSFSVQPLQNFLHEIIQYEFVAGGKIAYESGHVPPPFQGKTEKLEAGGPAFCFFPDKGERFRGGADSDPRLDISGGFLGGKA